jgi:prepilin-type N-terminal cleavage/methylation domain-containing protein
MKQRKAGFTLIELLVVIAIIGLLATLSVLALNNARAKSRDAKRVADVKQIMTALELYFNDKQSYPPATMVLPTSTLGIYSTTSSNTSTYMQVIPAPPTPPTTMNQYSYSVNAAGDSYTIMYYLEGAVGSITAGMHTANNAAIY